MVFDGFLKSYAARLQKQVFLGSQSKRVGDEKQTEEHKLPTWTLILCVRAVAQYDALACAHRAELCDPRRAAAEACRQVEIRHARALTPLDRHVRPRRVAQQELEHWQRVQPCAVAHHSDRSVRLHRLPGTVLVDVVFVDVIVHARIVDGRGRMKEEEKEMGERYFLSACVHLL